MKETKRQIRKEILDRLNRQDRNVALRKARIIKKKLFSLPEFKKAKFVMFYASMAGEVDTSEMIDEALRLGKRVVLPCCAGKKRIVPKEIRNRGKDLEKGTYGIYQPRKYIRTKVPFKRIDLIVVPAVAYDKQNRRLGRGKGYYDRFLKKLPRKRHTIGVAFDFQVIGNLPHDSHDIPVSQVITN